MAKMDRAAISAATEEARPPDGPGRARQRAGAKASVDYQNGGEPGRDPAGAQDDVAPRPIVTASKAIVRVLRDHDAETVQAAVAAVQELSREDRILIALIGFKAANEDDVADIVDCLFKACHGAPAWTA